MRRAVGLAAALVALAGCGEDRRDAEAPREASKLERALAAIDDCRVRSVVSLHSGALVLDLKNGDRIDLSTSDERRIQAAIERARPRCGNVIVAME